MKKIIAFIIMIILFTNTVSANGLNILTKRHLKNSRKIMVVMYHMISENPDHINTYCISPNEFEEDIIYLKNNNYVFSFPDEIDKTASLYPDKNIAVLTFDDGYESDYIYALPVLEKHGAKATFFIIGSMIGKPYYMNELQIKILSESEYAKLGNHSYSIHQNNLEELIEIFSDINNTAAIISDFNKNKLVLEKITGKTVDILSYPNSVYNFYMDNSLKNRGVCKISFSTEEKKFIPSNYRQVMGRYNRSDKRDVKAIDILLD